MSISGGAHVSIGDVPYMLDKSKPQPYKHGFESLFAQSTAIAGEVAKQQLRPEKMLWYITDWSGGEGFRIYYPQQPARYDKGSLMNVTQRGIITTRTRRYRTALARAGSAATTATRPAGGSAWNKAMVFWGDNLIYASDARGWVASTSSIPATYEFFDCDSDGRYLIAGVISEGGGTANMVPSADGSLITPTVTNIYSGTTASNPPTVNEVLEGSWYAWTLGSTGILTLRKGAGPGTANTLATTIYASGFVPTGFWGKDFWTDIETADNALYMSLGTPNGSVVFESRADVGRPFWTSPPGFTIKKLIYHAGVLFCLGAQMASGKKFAALWAIPLATRAPIFVAAPRRHRNEELFEWTIGCPGYGNTILVADENSGKIFIYDIDNDAISLFDDLANGGSGDGTSFTPTSSAELLAPTQRSLAASTFALNGWLSESGGGALSTGLLGHGSDIINSLMTTSVAAGVFTTLLGTAGIPVLPSTSYTVSYWHRGGSAGNGTAKIGMRWYTSAGALISTSADTNQTMVASTYVNRIYTATSPATAAYAALELTMTPTVNNSNADDFSFMQGVGATTDKLAFLAMHGSRLFGATYQPVYGVGTSLQIISWDDTLKENRDATQAISASIDSAEWDFGVPQELKALNGTYVTYEITDEATASGLVANSRITISYATDADIFTDTYTALATITSATTVATKGRHFIQVSDGTTTVKFSRIKFRITLDNNGSSSVAPPIIYSVVAEGQLMAYSEVWDLVVRIQDEANNERPKGRQWKAHQLMDNLEALAQNKVYVNFVDGERYAEDENRSTTHVVQVEDPQFVIEELDTGEGYCSVRLRAVPV